MDNGTGRVSSGLVSGWPGPTHAHLYVRQSTFCSFETTVGNTKAHIHILRVCFPNLIFSLVQFSSVQFSLVQFSSAMDNTFSLTYNYSFQFSSIQFSSVQLFYAEKNRPLTPIRNIKYDKDMIITIKINFNQNEN